MDGEGEKKQTQKNTDRKWMGPELSFSQLQDELLKQLPISKLEDYLGNQSLEHLLATSHERQSDVHQTNRSSVWLQRYARFRLHSGLCERLHSYKFEISCHDLQNNSLSRDVRTLLKLSILLDVIQPP